MSDAFAKFIHDVSKKVRPRCPGVRRQLCAECVRPQGFFEGCEKGSAQFEERFERAKTKFYAKYKPADAEAKEESLTPQVPDAERKAAAEAEKLKGNDHLRAGKLEEALASYSAAIELDPSNAIFFANRAAVQTKLGGTEQLEAAVADCKESSRLDPVRASRCLSLPLAL